MSKSIINGFAESNIACTYVYMGKTWAEVKKRYDTSAYKSYKAVLCFMPDSAAVFQVNNSSNWIIDLEYNRGSHSFSTISSTEIVNKQNFTCRLYIKKEKVVQIWEGFLETACDPSSKRAAIKASDAIMANLRSARVIE
jgi:hypothetical protein